VLHALENVIFTCLEAAHLWIVLDRFAMAGLQCTADRKQGQQQKCCQGVTSTVRPVRLQLGHWYSGFSPFLVVRVAKANRCGQKVKMPTHAWGTQDKLTALFFQATSTSVGCGCTVST